MDAGALEGLTKPEEPALLDRTLPEAETLRRGWAPLTTSVALPGVGRSPRRRRLLGTQIMAFRDAAGVAGATDPYCPHQGAPLDFGKIGEFGVRCMLHGWTFGVDGCRSDPAAAFRPATIPAYAVTEWGGLAWVSLAEEPPAFGPGTLPAEAGWASVLKKAPAQDVLAALGPAPQWHESPWGLTVVLDGAPCMVAPEDGTATTVWCLDTMVRQVRRALGLPDLV